MSFMRNLNTEYIPPKTLIHLVKQRPVIWNKSLQSKPSKTRDDAWKEVYETLVSNFNTLSPDMQARIANKITRRWYNLRDSFKKSLKQPRHKTYMYYRQMKFLNTVYKTDKTEDDDSYESEDNSEPVIETINVTKTEPEFQNDRDSEPNEVYFEPEFETTNSNEMFLNEPTTENKETKDENDINTIGILSSLIAREQDEDRGFFNSVMPSVKMLTQEQKMEFRMEVMKILKRLRDSDD